MNSISANGSQSDESAQVPEKSSKVVADFETAISLTGFGQYNYILIALGCLWNILCLVEVISFSFIVPILECHLDLNLSQRGLLTSIIFFGMVCGSVVWGVLSDLFGRQKVLVLSISMLGIVNIALGFSNTYTLMITFKFFSGFFVCAPLAIVLSYLGEMHSVAYRLKVLVGISVFYNAGNLVTSLLGLIFLTRKLEVHFLSTTLQSWQLLLLTVALLDIIGGALVCIVPESPKFLMSRGRSEEALQILKTMYKRNTGKHPDTYPIKILCDEATDSQEQVKPRNSDGCDDAQLEVNVNKCDFLSRSFKRAFSQIIPMFKPPHVSKCMLVFSIEFFLLLGVNTLRLWMPQVFSFMANDGNEFDICNEIQPDDMTNATTLESHECTSFVQPESIFVNSMIVQSVGIIGAILICIFINVIHTKLMLVGATLIASLASLTIYFSISPIMVVVMYSLGVGLSSAAHAAFGSILPSIGPTAFRSTVISISLTCGRIGSMLGTYLFPYLMAQTCWLPFVAVAVDLLFSSVLCIFLPRTTKKRLL
ncbi:synaptic vesicle glycoprotein 2B-like [Lutzomyia longipalpis]|uniref:synaptic vesicle glycoprotein 2B-like n=1 Tax=Lutzomyia longipalpis TaxID=7200 RepID=UPI002483D453|nr:synaptic vesicle glycoprotein 2B-like [Lutzomyia longipalpis]